MSEKTRRRKHRVAVELAGRQVDKVRYLAECYALSEEQACGLLARFGDDLDKLDDAARKLKSAAAQVHAITE